VSSVPKGIPSVTAELRTRLEAAWLALQPQVERTDEVGQNVLSKIIDTLVIMAKATPAPADEAQLRSYRLVSQRRTLRELDLIADAFESAARLLAPVTKGLHQPAIVALADVHIMRTDIAKAADDLLNIARRVRQAKAQVVPTRLARGGRPRNVRANLVAGWVISGYEELFGARINLPLTTQHLATLLTKIFAIMDIKANPRAAIAAATKKLLIERERKSSAA
jgi:hypothetical protein